jgi:hypothetical protein
MNRMAKCYTRMMANWSQQRGCDIATRAAAVVRLINPTLRRRLDLGLSNGMIAGMEVIWSAPSSDRSAPSLA